MAYQRTPLRSRAPVIGGDIYSSQWAPLRGARWSSGRQVYENPLVVARVPVQGIVLTNNTRFPAQVYHLPERLVGNNDRRREFRVRNPWDRPLGQQPAARMEEERPVEEPVERPETERRCWQMPYRMAPEAVERLKEQFRQADGSVCAICDEDPEEDRRYLVFKCGHGMCLDCLKQDLRIRGMGATKCAHCRADLTEDGVTTKERFLEVHPLSQSAVTSTGHNAAVDGDGERAL